ncbi:hypothetical protein KKC08_04950 [Patescibacteria group bacterium]|nr:hypothetical protein [Patescibacteria group bacterium]MCG2702318.1 hypothetical protein [Candidatus Parcubacteria bacterium]MBU4264992.1 hypothetical protein [Patescibacteria group bacterium]MBU4389829.1 hypothetical protein [Patescibacteria group bacterium]MBU4397485.1 hypothetical protein [Patescibacteria group bacterium]
MIYKIKIDRKLVNKILQYLAKTHSKGYPNTKNTCAKMHEKLFKNNNNFTKTANHLLYLTREKFIKEKHYTKGESLGFVDYSLTNRGIQYIQNSSYSTRYIIYKLKIEIDKKLIDRILYHLDGIEIKEENYPPKTSCLINIKKSFSDIDSPKLENHLFYLSRKGWIEEKHYAKGDALGFVDYCLDNKGMKYLGDKEDKSDNQFLDHFDRLIDLTLNQLEKENLNQTFKTFSQKFTKLIPFEFSNLDKMDYAQIFIGNRFSEKKQLLSELLELWKQIQENLLPFSDSPKNLTKSLLKTKLKVFQKKIKKIRNNSNTN